MVYQRLNKVAILPKRELALDLAEEAPQSAFTCSKLTIETPEQGVKYVQS